MKSLCLVIAISLSFISLLHADTKEAYYSSEISFSSEVFKESLASKYVEVCSDGSYLYRETKICFEFEIDYTHQDGVLFVRPSRLVTEDLESFYDIEIENFEFDLGSIKKELDIMEFKSTKINSILQIGALNASGYRQYVLDKESDVLSINIKVKLLWKYLSYTSREQYLDHKEASLGYSRIKELVSWGYINGPICYLSTLGKVFCLGTKKYGSFTDNQKNLVPIDFGTESPVVNLLETGRGSYCVLFANNSLKCWGGGIWSLLRDPNTQNHRLINHNTEELQIKDLEFFVFPEPIESIQANSKGICALTQTQKLLCLGDLDYMMGGLSEYSLKRMSGIKQIPYFDIGTDDPVTDLFVFEDGVCVVLAEINLKCWGNNFYGKMGQGIRASTIGATQNPVHKMDYIKIPKKPIKQVVGGGSKTCVIYKDGDLICWGGNWEGMLGQGIENTNAHQGESPGQIEKLKTISFESKIIKYIAISGAVCVLLETGKLKCWGRNTPDLGLSFDQLIGNAIGDHPGEMESLPDMPLGELKVVDIWHRHRNTCLKFEDNKHKCWGANGSGQLGQGSDLSFINAANSESLKPIFNGLEIDKFYLGYHRVCAIDKSGRAQCLGNNEMGVLGQNRNADNLGRSKIDLTTLSYIPLGNEKIEELFLFDQRTCALFANDRIKCWGVDFKFYNNRDNDDSDVPNALGDGSGEVEKIEYIKM